MIYINKKRCMKKEKKEKKKTRKGKNSIEWEVTDWELLAPALFPM